MLYSNVVILLVFLILLVLLNLYFYYHFDFQRKYFLQLSLIEIVYCNGSCKEFVSNISEGGRYVQGQKRCPECEVFIKWEGLWCPCCGRLLRTKPRAKKLKQKMSLNYSR